VRGIIDTEALADVPNDPNEPRFTITLECAERWGLYNENDAAIYLQALVKTEHLSRPDFDGDRDLPPV
jgi:hypothetical protein